MKGIALAVLIAAVAFVGGCGDDDNGNENTGTGAPATEREAGDAMKSDDDAMKSEGAAMKSDQATSEATLTSSRRVRVVKAINSEFGRVIADGKGEAFYLFDKEKSGKSECFGACARVWPPVLTRGKPRAGGGAKASLLGTTKRPNGKLQVTYAGQPLYYYVDDAPGTILCHDVSEFGGLWLVVKPNGKPAA